MPTPMLAVLVASSVALLQDGEGDGHAVVVNKENPTTSISVTQLRRIFLADMRFWPETGAVELMLPRAGSRSKEALLEHVYAMTERELKRYWSELIYRNRIVNAPRVLPSAVVANRVLERMRGAVTVLPSEELLAEAKVKTLAVDGKLPGDEGYPLKDIERPDTSLEVPAFSGEPRATDAGVSAAQDDFEELLETARILQDVQSLEDWNGDGWPPVHVRLFGHGEYEYEEEKDQDGEKSTNSGFSIESLDVLVTSAITEHLSVLAETIIEALDEEEDDDFEVEVERLMLTYRVNDAFQVYAGRFLTGIGYWNVRYNHGEWLQTSIDRPEVLDFEDDSGLLPVHGVGLGIHGTFFTEPVALDYTVELTNGRGPTQSVVQNKEDANKAKALNVSFGIEPECVPGLRFGGGVYLDDIPSNEDPGAGPEHGRLDETIQNVFVAYDRGKWEVMGEYFWLEQDGDGVDADSNGWYVQVGRHFGAWTPYVRVDEIERADDNVYFDTAEDGFTTAIGIRYDFERQVALTLQYEDADADAAPGEDEEDTQTFVLQASFSF